MNWFARSWFTGDLDTFSFSRSLLLDVFVNFHDGFVSTFGKVLGRPGGAGHVADAPHKRTTKLAGGFWSAGGGYKLVHHSLRFQERHHSRKPYNQSHQYVRLAAGVARFNADKDRGGQ